MLKKRNLTHPKDAKLATLTSCESLCYSGMILSNKEKTGKLSNTKSGRPAHVEDMSRARRSRCAFPGGFGGMLPQENFCFQHGFLDF